MRSAVVQSKSNGTRGTIEVGELRKKANDDARK